VEFLINLSAFIPLKKLDHCSTFYSSGVPMYVASTHAVNSRAFVFEFNVKEFAKVANSDGDGLVAHGLSVQTGGAD
jgi:hypothetical protein